MSEKPSPTFEQAHAAMQAMISQAMKTPEEPVAMAIADDTGNLVAYARMDNLRLYGLLLKSLHPRGLRPSPQPIQHRGQQPPVPRWLRPRRKHPEAASRVCFDQKGLHSLMADYPMGVD